MGFVFLKFVNFVFTLPRLNRANVTSTRIPRMRNQTASGISTNHLEFIVIVIVITSGFSNDCGKQ